MVHVACHMLSVSLLSSFASIALGNDGACDAADVEAVPSLSDVLLQVDGQQVLQMSPVIEEEKSAEHNLLDEVSTCNGRPLEAFVARSESPTLIERPTVADREPVALAPGAVPASARLATLIPRPYSVTPTGGEFRLEPGVAIFLNLTLAAEPSAKQLAMQTAELCAEQLSRCQGPTCFAVPVLVSRSSSAEEGAAPRRGDVHLVLEPDLAQNFSPSLGPEGYTLEVSESAAAIRAATAQGLFYGFQTLRQLLPPEIYSREFYSEAGPLTASGVFIVDTPRFGWRGAHLDVGRHFFPKDVVLRYIDLLSQHKMNTFHWHLTEDQGWRIEIKRFPKLMTVGSVRDWDPPGTGFYTQEDIREVVEYAAARHVTVVPEIEMPGHASAAIAAYPELGSGHDVKVRASWGVSDEVFNVRNETFAFLKGVLDEVLALFPSEYIHIGGDEVPKTQWSQSSESNAQMHLLHIRDHDYGELQAWFVSQIAEYLMQRGRRVIGWEEITKGTVPPSITVMSWTSVDPGIAAAARGHDVIMAPQQITYFDRSESHNNPFVPFACCTTVSDVYSFNPVPDTLPEQMKRRVKGLQWQVWTEFIKRPEHIEFMTWPRGCALAETMWTTQDNKDKGRFMSSLPYHLRRLATQRVSYRAVV